MQNYNDNNVMAKILRNEIPAKIFYQDEFMIVIHDIYPKAPTHLLAIPRGKFTSYQDFVVDADDKLFKHFFKTIASITKEIGADAAGYRLITNHGKHGNQTIPHFHVHILAGKLMEGF